MIWALSEHPTLQGPFRRADLIGRALEEASHRGYQRWRLAYNPEVVEWLMDPANRNTTREDFLRFLREIYDRPEMRQRFPDALKEIDRLLGGAK